MTWRSLPAGSSLTDWWNLYRFAGLDVTVRGGEYVGLWIGDRIVAVDVDSVMGPAILEIAPTPALAYTDCHGPGLLLATKDIAPSTVIDTTPDLGVIARPGSTGCPPATTPTPTAGASPPTRPYSRCRRTSTGHTSPTRTPADASRRAGQPTPERGWSMS